MKNIKLTIAYDGTHFLGWQRSIETTLQKGLERILQEPIALQAASRTDRGVHAEGQVVNFFTKNPLVNDRLPYRLNSVLPSSLIVKASEEMPSSFHPTLDVKQKTYLYRLCLGVVQLPHHRLYSWHISYPLNREKMAVALPHFLGERDFSAFCNNRKELRYPHKRRTLTSIEMTPLEHERLEIAVSGVQFLYKMVRNIVGTLVYVGLGKIGVEEIPHIFASKSRPQAGLTAPAHGLTLKEIVY